MKKFLAVFDGYKMSKSTLQYSLQLAKQANAHLVGVFLDEFIYRSYNVYEVFKHSDDPYKEIKNLDAVDAKKRDAAVLMFKDTCEKAGLAFTIHRDKNIAIHDLKHESMFADLVIINENETFNKKKEKLPTAFIRDLLGDVQCPVLLVPTTFKLIDKIVLLYDGGPSSLFAIRMFSYLFNNLADLPVDVFTVKDLKHKGSHIPDDKLLKEFIKRHFPNAKYNLAKGDAEEKVVGYLRHHGQNELVVLGAYRRSEVSRWFKTSMADVLMKELETPLFIAHQ